MQLLNKYAPLVIVLLILMTGLTAGLVLSQNQQTIQHQASEKRQSAVSLLDTLPPPSDAQRITVSTSNFRGDLEHTGFWSTSASVVAVVDHYLQELEANDWQLIHPTSLDQSNIEESLQNTHSQLLIAEKNTKQAYISINRTQGLLSLTEIKIDIPSYVEFDSTNNNLLLKDIKALFNNQITTEESSDSAQTIALLSNTSLQGQNQDIAEVISNNKTDILIHLGDTSTELNPNLWSEEIAKMNPTLSIFFAPGDYDVAHANWQSECQNQLGCVADVFKESIEDSTFQLELPENSSLETFLSNSDGIETYALVNENLHVAFIGLGDFDQSKESISSTYYAPFVKQTFADSQASLKICALHETRYELQVGDQANAHNWDIFEACQEAGALIVTGADGSYSRTKPLTSLVRQLPLIDAATQSALVSSQEATVINSGLGGAIQTKQVRCRAAELNTGCNQEWASVYTTNQYSQPGALFISLLPKTVSSQSRFLLAQELTELSPSLKPSSSTNNTNQFTLLGYGYFETIDKEVIDLFTLWKPTSDQEKILGVTTPIISDNTTPDETTIDSDTQNNFCQDNLSLLRNTIEGKRLYKDVSCH